jgi:hypothetical protein
MAPILPDESAHSRDAVPDRSRAVIDEPEKTVLLCYLDTVTVTTLERLRAARAELEQAEEELQKTHRNDR